MRSITKQSILNVILSCALLTLVGCTQYGHLEPVPYAPRLLPEDVPEYKVQPGDDLTIKFFYSPELNESVTVRPDGRISLQLIDDVVAAGKTPTQLDQTLTERYRDKLTDNPDLSVIVRTFESQRVYVAGEIRTPGEYPLKDKMTIMHAITTAGGFTDDSKQASILVIRQQDPDDPIVYVANLTDENLTRIGKDDTYAPLMPRDIVYVPKSDIAKVNLFMDQFVRDALMFNGISAGFTGIYELNNKDQVGVSN